MGTSNRNSSTHTIALPLNATCAHARPGDTHTRLKAAGLSLQQARALPRPRADEAAAQRARRQQPNRDVRLHLPGGRAPVRDTQHAAVRGHAVHPPRRCCRAAGPAGRLRFHRLLLPEPAMAADWPTLTPIAPRASPAPAIRPRPAATPPARAPSPTPRPSTARTAARSLGRCGRKTTASASSWRRCRCRCAGGI